MSRLLPLPFVRSLSQRRMQQTVGIDLTDRSLRLVCVALRGDSMAWVSRAEIPWQTLIPWQVSGPMRPTTQAHRPWADALADQVAAHLPFTVDALRRPTSVVLPSSHSVLRCPSKTSDEELEASLREDLATAIEPDDVLQVCTWQANSVESANSIGSVSQSQSAVNEPARQVYYALSSRSCSAIARVVYQGGYGMPRIESRPHALARAAACTDQNHVYGILEWGPDDCTLVLLGSDNQPSMARSFYGFALNKYLGVAPVEATVAATDATLNELHEIAPSTTQEPAAAIPLQRRRQGLESCVAAAADEIRKTIRLQPGLEERLQQQAKQQMPRLLICGEAAENPAIYQGLSMALGHAVAPWSWNCGPRPRRHALEPSDARFAVALGAACGGGA